MAYIAFVTNLGGIVEEGEHRVIVLLRNGVILVVVALGALGGHGQDALSVGFGFIQNVLDAVFLGNYAAFFGVLMVAVKPGCQHFFLVRIRQHVARQRPGHEFVVSEVFVEGVNQPVPPRPLGADVVVLVAVRIGVARNVQPVQGHFFAVGRLLQHLIHDFGVSLLAIISQKLVLQFQRRHQARQVQRNALEQVLLVSSFIG